MLSGYVRRKCALRSLFNGRLFALPDVYSLYAPQFFISMRRTRHTNCALCREPKNAVVSIVHCASGALLKLYTAKVLRVYDTLSM